jgi:Fic family protein
MKALIKWINTESKSLHPVVVAGIVHYEIVRIHPFVNGNGRTARALASLILCLRSFDIKKYFALDEHYNVNKTAYVDALKSADDSADLTEWLEYFTDGVLISVHKVFKMISDLPPIVDEPVELTEDQIKVVNHVHQNERITRKETGELLNLSGYKSNKILKELMDMEILKLEGKGSGTHYIFDI